MGFDLKTAISGIQRWARKPKEKDPFQARSRSKDVLAAMKQLETGNRLIHDIGKQGQDNAVNMRKASNAEERMAFDKKWKEKDFVNETRDSMSKHRDSRTRRMNARIGAVESAGANPVSKMILEANLGSSGGRGGSKGNGGGYGQLRNTLEQRLGTLIGDKVEKRADRKRRHVHVSPNQAVAAGWAMEDPNNPGSTIPRVFEIDPTDSPRTQRDTRLANVENEKMHRYWRKNANHIVLTDPPPIPDRSKPAEPKLTKEQLASKMIEDFKTQKANLDAALGVKSQSAQLGMLSPEEFQRHVQDYDAQNAWMRSEILRIAGEYGVAPELVKQLDGKDAFVPSDFKFVDQSAPSKSGAVAPSATSQEPESETEEEWRARGGGLPKSTPDASPLGTAPAPQPDPSTQAAAPQPEAPSPLPSPGTQGPSASPQNPFLPVQVIPKEELKGSGIARQLRPYGFGADDGSAMMTGGTGDGSEPSPRIAGSHAAQAKPFEPWAGDPYDTFVGQAGKLAVGAANEALGKGLAAIGGAAYEGGRMLGAEADEQGALATGIRGANMILNPAQAAAGAFNLPGPSGTMGPEGAAATKDAAGRAAYELVPGSLAEVAKMGLLTFEGARQGFLEGMDEALKGNDPKYLSRASHGALKAAAAGVWDNDEHATKLFDSMAKSSPESLMKVAKGVEAFHDFLFSAEDGFVGKVTGIKFGGPKLSVKLLKEAASPLGIYRDIEGIKIAMDGVSKVVASKSNKARPTDPVAAKQEAEDLQLSIDQMSQIPGTEDIVAALKAELVEVQNVGKDQGAPAPGEPIPSTEPQSANADQGLAEPGQPVRQAPMSKDGALSMFAKTADTVNAGKGAPGSSQPQPDQPKTSGEMLSIFSESAKAGKKAAAVQPEAPTATKGAQELKPRNENAAVLRAARDALKKGPESSGFADAMVALGKLPETPVTKAMIEAARKAWSENSQRKAKAELESESPQKPAATPEPQAGPERPFNVSEEDWSTREGLEARAKSLEEPLRISREAGNTPAVEFIEDTIAKMRERYKALAESEQVDGDAMSVAEQISADQRSLAIAKYQGDTQKVKVLEEGIADKKEKFKSLWKLREVEEASAKKGGVPDKVEALVEEASKSEDVQVTRSVDESGKTVIKIVGGDPEGIYVRDANASSGPTLRHEDPDSVAFRPETALPPQGSVPKGSLRGVGIQQGSSHPVVQARKAAQAEGPEQALSPNREAQAAFDRSGGKLPNPTASDIARANEIARRKAEARQRAEDGQGSLASRQAAEVDRTLPQEPDTGVVPASPGRVPPRDTSVPAPREPMYPAADTPLKATPKPSTAGERTATLQAMRQAIGSLKKGFADTNLKRSTVEKWAKGNKPPRAKYVVTRELRALANAYLNDPTLADSLAGKVVPRGEPVLRPTPDVPRASKRTQRRADKNHPLKGERWSDREGEAGGVQEPSPPKYGSAPVAPMIGPIRQESIVDGKTTVIEASARPNAPAGPKYEGVPQKPRDPSYSPPPPPKELYELRDSLSEQEIAGAADVASTDPSFVKKVVGLLDKHDGHVGKAVREAMQGSEGQVAPPLTGKDLAELESLKKRRAEMVTDEWAMRENGATVKSDAEFLADEVRRASYLKYKQNVTSKSGSGKSYSDDYDHNTHDYKSQDPVANSMRALWENSGGDNKVLAEHLDSIIEGAGIKWGDGPPKGDIDAMIETLDLPRRRESGYAPEDIEGALRLKDSMIRDNQARQQRPRPGKPKKGGGLVGPKSPLAEGALGEINKSLESQKHETLEGATEAITKSLPKEVVKEMEASAVDPLAIQDIGVFQSIRGWINSNFTGYFKRIQDFHGNFDRLDRARGYFQRLASATWMKSPPEVRRFAGEVSNYSHTVRKSLLKTQGMWKLVKGERKISGPGWTAYNAAMDNYVRNGSPEQRAFYKQYQDYMDLVIDSVNRANPNKPPIKKRKHYMPWFDRRPDHWAMSERVNKLILDNKHNLPQGGGGDLFMREMDPAKVNETYLTNMIFTHSGFKGEIDSLRSSLLEDAGAGNTIQQATPGAADAIRIAMDHYSGIKEGQQIDGWAEMLRDRSYRWLEKNGHGADAKAIRDLTVTHIPNKSKEIQGLLPEDGSAVTDKAVLKEISKAVKEYKNMVRARQMLLDKHPKLGESFRFWGNSPTATMFNHLRSGMVLTALGGKHGLYGLLAQPIDAIGQAHKAAGQRRLAVGAARVLAETAVGVGKASAKSVVRLFGGKDSRADMAASALDQAATKMMNGLFGGSLKANGEFPDLFDPKGGLTAEIGAHNWDDPLARRRAEVGGPGMSLVGAKNAAVEAVKLLSAASSKTNMISFEAGDPMMARALAYAHDSLFQDLYRKYKKDGGLNRAGGLRKTQEMLKDLGPLFEHRGFDSSKELGGLIGAGKIVEARNRYVQMMAEEGIVGTRPLDRPYYHAKNVMDTNLGPAARGAWSLASLFSIHPFKRLEELSNMGGPKYSVVPGKRALKFAVTGGATVAAYSTAVALIYNKMLQKMEQDEEAMVDPWRVALRGTMFGPTGTALENPVGKLAMHMAEVTSGKSKAFRLFARDDEVISEDLARLSGPLAGMFLVMNQAKEYNLQRAKAREAGGSNVVPSGVNPLNSSRFSGRGTVEKVKGAVGLADSAASSVADFAGKGAEYKALKKRVKGKVRSEYDEAVTKFPVIQEGVNQMLYPNGTPRKRSSSKKRKGRRLGFFRKKRN